MEHGSEAVPRRGAAERRGDVCPDGLPLDAIFPVVQAAGTFFAMSADDFIKSSIFTIRGVQVMPDSDSATIYKVETRVFNQAAKRN